jgi:hypothetical protein
VERCARWETKAAKKSQAVLEVSGRASWGAAVLRPYTRLVMR